MSERWIAQARVHGHWRDVSCTASSFVEANDIFRSLYGDQVYGIEESRDGSVMNVRFDFINVLAFFLVIVMFFFWTGIYGVMDLVFKSAATDPSYSILNMYAPFCILGICVFFWYVTSRIIWRHTIVCAWVIGLLVVFQLIVIAYH